MGKMFGDYIVSAERRKEVSGYFQSRGEAYPSDASEDLELDYDLVWEITEELRREGRLEVI